MESITTFFKHLLPLAFVVLMAGSCSGDSTKSDEDNYPPRAPREAPEGCVDMGGDIFWAECNLGASSPGKIGYLYKWGETSPSKVQEEKYYTFWSSESNEYTKYNSKDKKRVLEPVDDAVTAELGEGWRTPTVQEWNFLINHCDCENWAVKGEEQGVILTSRITGECLYLYADYNNGCLWTATLYDIGSAHITYVHRYSTAIDCWSALGPRYYLLAIRPVHD